MKRHSCLPFVLLLFLAIGVLAAILFIPVLAAGFYGPPSPYLSAWQRFSYSASLLWDAGDLTIPRNPNGLQQIFVIEMGESVYLESLAGSRSDPRGANLPHLFDLDGIGYIRASWQL
ncbi:MAG: hypothetical protein Q8M58_12565 [Anaerolineales bacterium]|nr:hypothetical protein [Anaerolineales bacterium]